MESGSGGESGPDNEREPQEGPQSPAGPQSPGPQSPGPQSPGPQSPGPQPADVPPPPPGGGFAPPVGAQPQAPPPPGGPQAPAYGGPVPPGGWQQPVAQQPQFQGELASWGSRVGATLLDGLVIIGLFIVLGLVVGGGFALSNGVGIALLVILGLVWLAASFVYAAYFMARPAERNGQTLGKQVVGIRAVRDNGQPFTFGSAFVREFLVKGLLFGTVGSFFFYIPTLVDWLWPLWDDTDRALHDMVISTHVVRE